MAQKEGLGLEVVQGIGYGLVAVVICVGLGAYIGLATHSGGHGKGHGGHGDKAGAHGSDHGAESGAESGGDHGGEKKAGDEGGN